MDNPTAVPKFRDTDGTYRPIYYHRPAASFTKSDKEANNTTYISAIGEVRILDDENFSITDYTAYADDSSTTLSPLAIKNLISNPNNIIWPDNYKIPLSAIPDAAIETIVKYSSLETASTAYINAVDGSKPFQVGDTVQLTEEPYTMYIVTAIPGSATDINCYTEYSAGTAAKALQADNATNAANADVADKLSVNGGSATQPIYFANGVPVTTTYNLDIYKGATETTAGQYGLVPRPVANSDLLFLSNKQGEEWYALQPSNIGALSLEGGTLTGSLTMSSGTTIKTDSILPSTNNTGNIGSSARKYSNIYAYTFNGDLKGNAETSTIAELAEGLNITLQYSGDVKTVSQSLNGPYQSLTTMNFDLRLRDMCVRITNLNYEIGVIQTKESAPGDSRVELWIQRFS